MKIEEERKNALVKQYSEIERRQNIKEQEKL